MNETLRAYVVYLAIMSVVSFFLYGNDKSRAVKKKWRIKEKTLLYFGILGGAVGALLGMKIFHHKTKHGYFWIVNIIGLIWQIGLLLVMSYELI